MRVLTFLSLPGACENLSAFLGSTWMPDGMFTVDTGRGLSILQYAVMIGNLDILRTLKVRLTRRSSVGHWYNQVESMVSLASKYGRVEVIRWLMLNRPVSDIHKPLPPDYDRNVMIAAMRCVPLDDGTHDTRQVVDSRCVALSDFLYELDPTGLNTQDRFGMSAVSYAVLSGSSVRMDWVIARCGVSDLDVRTSTGHSLLNLAIKSGNVDTLIWLLENAQLGQIGQVGPPTYSISARAAFRTAVNSQCLDMCEFVTSSEGWTALVDSSTEMLDCGALACAVGNNDLSMVVWLRDYYASLGHVDVFNSGGLFKAAAKYHASGQHVLHWLCANYEEYRPLLGGVADLSDDEITLNNRIMCCYYDPFSTGSSRCTERSIQVGLDALAVGDRLCSWKGDVADQLNLVVPPLDVRNIIMGYALCVQQFLPN